MSEQPESGSDTPDAAATEPVAAWSANGTEHEHGDTDAAADAPDASDTPEADAEATQVGSVADVSPDPTGTSPDADDPAAFLNELVRAMQSTAGAERARIAADTDRRRDEHLAAIQARRESEAEKMRELAAEDLKAIDAWAEDERQRIQLEHDRRAAARDKDLETSLAAHGAGVDREIEGVEAAIATYRIDVDAFFAILDRETDPVAIAQHAARRPVFPTLEHAGTAAAGVTSAGDDPSATTPADADAAAGEPPIVGVMDPHPGAGLAASVAAWNAAGSNASIEPAPDIATAEAAEADAAAEAAEAAEADAAAEAAEPGVPVAVARGAHENGPGTILHAVPSGRPLSWLRRGGDSNDRSGEEH